MNGKQAEELRKLAREWADAEVEAAVLGITKDLGENYYRKTAAKKELKFIMKLNELTKE